MQYPILINDNSNIATVGDLMICESIEDVRHYFESWFVDEQYFAFDIKGRGLKLYLNQEEQLDIKEKNDQPCPDIVRAYLLQYAQLYKLPEQETNDLDNIALATRLKEFQI